MSSASSLERDHACPASVKIAAGLTPSQKALADLVAQPMDYTTAGQDFHAEMEAAINADNVPEDIAPFVPAIAHAEHSFVLDLRTMEVHALGIGVDRDYARRLADLGLDIPKELRHEGTIDCYGTETDGTAVVIDWKTGLEVSDPEHNKQMLLYAFFVSRHLSADNVTMRIVYRRGEDSTPYKREYVIDAMELMAFADAQRSLPAKIKGATPEQATPGGHCRHCPAKPGCPKFGLATTAAKFAALRDPETELIIPDHERVHAVEMLEMLSPFVKKLQSALRGNVIAQGDIAMPDGRLYGIRTKKGNEVIDAEKAFTVIADKYGMVAALAATKKEISKTSLKASLSLAKDEGQTLAAAEREALKLLRDAGAISNRADSETVGFVAVKELKDGAE